MMSIANRRRRQRGVARHHPLGAQQDGDEDRIDNDRVHYCLRIGRRTAGGQLLAGGNHRTSLSRQTPDQTRGNRPGVSMRRWPIGELRNRRCQALDRSFRWQPS
jgi:hypothetical protein